MGYHLQLCLFSLKNAFLLSETHFFQSQPYVGLKKSLWLMLKHCFVLYFIHIYWSVSAISSDPPCKEDNARFTTVHLKPFTVSRCINISEPAWIPLKCGLMYAVYWLTSTQLICYLRNFKYWLFYVKSCFQK